MKNNQPGLICHVFIPKSKKFNGGSIAWFLDNLKVNCGWVDFIDLEHEIRVTLPLDQAMKDIILKPVLNSIDTLS